MKKEGLRWLQNATQMSLFGITMQQTWPDLWLWEKLLNEHPEVKTIIEIGTKYGGFSLYLLSQAIQRDMGFLTFDIKQCEHLLDPLAKRLGFPKYFIKVNVFANDGDEVKECLSLRQLHPLILFCDGGDKQMEFRMFVPCLHPGDIVGAHDWNMEFWPSSLEGLEHLIEPLMWEECEALDSWTRFWTRISNGEAS